MTAFVTLFKGILSSLLPGVWQKVCFEFGLVVAFGVGSTLLFARNDAATATIAVGATFIVFPFAFRVVARVRLALLAHGVKPESIEILRYALGRPLFAKAVITNDDELVYFFVEESGAANERIGGSTPYRGVFLSKAGGQWSRDAIVYDDGHQLRSRGELVWPQICGAVSDEDGSLLMWSLAPSYGNRGENYSAYLTYYGAGGEKRYCAMWRSHDDFSDVFGVVKFEPPALGVPLTVRRHAASTLKKAGFEYRETESPLDREARFWLTAYRTLLRQYDSVTVTDNWFARPEPTIRNDEIECGGHVYFAAGWRSSPIVKLRPDGMCTVVYVGFGFPHVAVDGRLVVITDGPNVLEYDPDTRELTKRGGEPA